MAKISNYLDAGSVTDAENVGKGRTSDAVSGGDRGHGTPVWKHRNMMKSLNQPSQVANRCMVVFNDASSDLNLVRDIGRRGSS